MSPPTCGRWADGHLDIGKASEVPNLKDKHPLNMAANGWFAVSSLPTVVKRTQGDEISTYAFFIAPIAMTATKNATGAPDDPAMQTAEIGVTAATPTYSIYSIAADPATNSATRRARRAERHGTEIRCSCQKATHKVSTQDNRFRRRTVCAHPVMPAHAGIHDLPSCRKRSRGCRHAPA